MVNIALGGIGKGFRSLACAAILVLGTLSASSAADCTIKVGSKAFHEEFWMGEMISLLLEQEGYQVERFLGLGGTKIVHEALIRGDIDVYPEYGNTGWSTILKQPTIFDADELYVAVKEAYAREFNVLWLEPIGFADVYSFITTPARAAELGLSKLSDLATMADKVTIAGSHEFFTRADTLPRLEEALGGVTFSNKLSMDPGVVYTAVREGEVDIGAGFSSDGRISKWGLMIVEDDMNFWYPGIVAPLVRADTAERCPKVVPALMKLGNTIDTPTAQQLNWEFDGEGKSAREIAETHLRLLGLLK